MKNKEESPFKLPVWGICVVLLLLVIWEVAEERMGTFPNYRSGRHSHNELLGIFMPLMVLIYPIFQKKYKKRILELEKSCPAFFYIDYQYSADCYNVCKQRILSYRLDRKRSLGLGSLSSNHMGCVDYYWEVNMMYNKNKQSI